MTVSFIFHNEYLCTPRDELGLITPSLNILSTLSWINNRSSWLKCRDLVAMGFTPAVRLENKLTSWVSATTTAQVFIVWDDYMLKITTKFKDDALVLTLKIKAKNDVAAERWENVQSRQCILATFNNNISWWSRFDFTFTEVDGIRNSCDEGYEVKLSLLQMDEWM